MSLFNPRGSSTYSDIQQLRAIGTNGSAQPVNGERVFSDHRGPIQADHLFSRSKLNWRQRLSQSLFLGAVESQVFRHQVGQQRDRYVHGEEQRTVVTREDNEVGRILGIRKSRKHGESVVRATECTTLLSAMDAVFWCTKKNDEHEQWLEKHIQNKEKRRQAIEANDLMLQRCLSNITLSAFGPNVDPARWGHGEEIR